MDSLMLPEVARGIEFRPEGAGGSEPETLLQRFLADCPKAISDPTREDDVGEDPLPGGRPDSDDGKLIVSRLDPPEDE